MKRRFAILFSMFLLVLATSINIFAQGQTGSIEGTVKDSNGAVVPNVTITVATSSATSTGGVSTIGFRRETTTNSDGFFRVLQVPPGTYTVTAAATSGFGQAVREGVTVVVEKASQLEVEVKPTGVDNTVVVGVGDAPPVDTTDTKILTSINAQKIELLPKGVDFTSVLKTVPGTRGEGLAGGFSVDGASGSENVFVIDGQEVTNFRTGTLNGNNAIPTQFVQEVSVKSSGFEAEFGGATGGVISVVTKGGSNDFRGEFGSQFTTPKLNGGNRPVLFRFTRTPSTAIGTAQTTEYITSPKSQGTNFFPTANLSGPVIKDRVWFFASYTPQIFTTRTTTNFFTNGPATAVTATANSGQQVTFVPRSYLATETYDFKRTYNYAFTRLDASVTNNLRLTGTYTWNPIVDKGAAPFSTISLGAIATSGEYANLIAPIGRFKNSSLGTPVVTSGGTFGQLTGSQLTSLQGGRQNSTNVTGQAVWTPTSNIVISGRYSRGFLNEKLGSYFNPDTTRFRCQSGGSTFGACTTGIADPVNTQVLKDVSIRTNYEIDGTFLVTGFLGKHEFKGGYQRFKIFNDVNRGYKDLGIVDLYYGYSIEDLGAPVTPTCTGGTCIRDTDGNITNLATIGAGEIIRFGTVGRASNLNQSVYVQDKWQPFNRLTLQLGVRAEKEDLPSFNGLAPPINFNFNDKIAPRLGFALDPFGDGKTRIFASYGQFYDRLKFELPRGSFGGDFYRVDFFEIFPNQGDFRSYTYPRILGNFSDPVGGRCPSTGFIGSGISRCQFDYRIASNDPSATIYTGKVDPDLKPFRQTEFTAGLERQLGRDFLIRGRYTFKNVDSAIEDAGIINAQGSEAYIIGNPGSGLHAQLLKELGYTKSTEPQRRYDGMEVTFEKRLSNNYYFNLNYTYSRLYGNYSGLASSDEAGRTSPGVNRFFDLPFIGFTATGEKDNGRLATDRPHVFNAYGAYIFDWFGNKANSTEFSFFTTAQSGTLQTTTIPFITTTIFTKRGDLGRTEMFTQTDFSASHKYRFGRDNRFTMAFDLNILNLFDEKNVTAVSTGLSTITFSPTSAAFGGVYTNADGSGNYVKFINDYTAGKLQKVISDYINNANVPSRKFATYDKDSGYQGPRSVRFGFRLLF